MDKVIKVKNLTKKFGDFTAVDAISFEVSKGEIFGFLGANGAGKTTAMRMLCGLLSSTSGEASVAGFDIHRETEKLKKNIGQKFSLYEDLTVRENFHFYGGVYGLRKNEVNERMDEMLERLDLQNEKKSIVGALPLGWKQKLSFSLAQVHRPDIIFLDEPTGGVDPITRRQFWEMIYASAHEGVTIFVTTHYMDEAEYCDRVSIMVDGKIEALDDPAELKRKYDAGSMDGVFQVLARGTSVKG